MTLTISRALLNAILADARQDAAHERCGLLLGDGASIAGFVPAANVAGSPADMFELDPAVLLAAHRRARAGGAAVIGHYHSHPNGAVDPSPHDAAAAHADGQFWLVITATSWSSWRAQADGAWLNAFTPAALTITDA
jgi:desampylase